MGILEIIAEQHLGSTQWAAHPELRSALSRLGTSISQPNPSVDEKARINALVELCFEYDREDDSDEKANILRTIEEISVNAPMEIPVNTIEEWDEKLSSGDPSFSKAKQKLVRDQGRFLKTYFSLRARAELATQSAVAKKAGLTRSYVAVIESGGKPKGTCLDS